MTFTELAAIRGISKLSAASLVRRHGWRRQRDNQGHVIALVPASWISNEAADRPDSKADDNRAITALEHAITVLREHLQAAERRAETERARADRAEQARDAADAHAVAIMNSLRADHDRAEASAAGERSRVDELRGRLEALLAELNEQRIVAEEARAQAKELTQAAEATRLAAAARRSEGVLARLRRVWRGD